MKKFFALILVACIACAGLFAGGRKDVSDEKFNVLPSYTSMEMDMISYGNTVYEAVVATDQADSSKECLILINKYVNNAYDSSFQIELEGFKCWEFDENYSHYDFLKLYALGPNEIALTVYAAYSDNRFAFFRIRDGKVVSYKSYSLKNQSAYESQRYAFNGKDTIYVAFDGQRSFKLFGWDLFLLAFDLDGNLKKSVSVFTPRNDELIGLAAFEDKVYFGIRQSFERQAILQLTGDLEFEKCLGCKYDGSDIRFIDFKNDAGNENLLVKLYMKNSDSTLVSRYSGSGDFICSYDIDESSSDTTYNYCKSRFFDGGVLFFGQRVEYDGEFGKRLGAGFITYFVDWDGNKTYEKIFARNDNLNFRNFAFVDGKYLCAGENIYTADGIGHVSYTYMIAGEGQDSNFVSIEKSDKNPFELSDEPVEAKKMEDEIRRWKAEVKVMPTEIPFWEFGYSAKIIRLPYKHVQPDSTEITDTIPLFPFSER